MNTALTRTYGSPSAGLPPSSPTTPRQSMKHLPSTTTPSSSAYRTPTSQWGRSSKRKLPADGSNLEDDDLFNWLQSGRMRRVILSTRKGYVLTAPLREGAVVHTKDKAPGTMKIEKLKCSKLCHYTRL